MAILDALLCVLVDHEPLQKEFVDLHGVEVCVRVLKNPAFGREVRAVSLRIPSFFEFCFMFMFFCFHVFYVF